MTKKFILAIPITLVFISILTLFSSLSKSNVKNNNPNAILIMVDDLRPEINCYNKTRYEGQWLQKPYGSTSESSNS